MRWSAFGETRRCDTWSITWRSSRCSRASGPCSILRRPTTTPKRMKLSERASLQGTDSCRSTGESESNCTSSIHALELWDWFAAIGRRVSASRPGRLGLLRLRAEGSRRVALGSVRPRELALVRQLLDRLLLVVRARERREKGHDVVDVVLGQRERLDVLVQIGIL